MASTPWPLVNSQTTCACAAASATLDIYEDEGLFTRAKDLSGLWEDAIHSLRGLPHVVDIRTIGLMAAIELDPREVAPTRRGYEVFVDCFENGLLTRLTGDTIALSPPLIVEEKHIDELVQILSNALKRLS